MMEGVPPIIGTNYWICRKYFSKTRTLPFVLQQLLHIEPLPFPYQRIRPGKLWQVVHAKMLSEAIANDDVAKLCHFLSNGANPNNGIGPKSSPLLEAATQNKPNLIHILMRYGANPSHLFPLHRAAAGGKMNALKALLEWVPVDQIDSSGRSALYWASTYNRLEVISYLVRLGADINRSNTDKGECTVLISAVESDHAAAVRLLLQLGADPNKPAVNGWTPLFQAAKCNSVRSLAVLLESGRVNVNESVSEYELTAVAAAIDKGNYAALKVLISFGADIRSQLKKQKITPLQQAIRANRPDLVTLLLDAGVDVNYTQGQYSPLRHAAEVGSVELVRLLLSYGGDPSKRSDDDNKATSVYIAALCGFVDVIAVLLFEHQPHLGLTAQSLARDDGRKTSLTPLIGAILHKDEAVGLKIAKLLVEHGAQVDDLICDLHETSALWFAVKYKKFRLARFFVEECNANVNVASVSTMMPVLLLAINTDIEFAKFLLKHGADPNFRFAAAADTTLLAQATIQGNLEAVKMLVRAGADLYALSDNKRSALQLASLEGFTEIVRFFLSEGVPADFYGPYGSPLMSACLRGHLAIVQLLLQCGADINKERDSWTPLTAAVRGNQLDVVRYLISKGVDRRHVEQDGTTALSWAQKLGYGQIAALLRN